MADRKDYYFRQLLTEEELDAGFDYMENADRAIMADQALDGVFRGGEVSEQLTPSLSVDVAGPGLCYDQLGRRVAWTPNQVVDASEDELGAPTAVVTPGNAKVVTVFVEFDRVLSDPRTDGNSANVFFDRTESFRLNVVQGGEAASGMEVAPPARDDQLILADITLVYGQVAIVNADIDSLTRRQDAFVLTGAPNSEREGTVRAALQAFQDQINEFINNGSSLIGYDGGPAWADGTTNPATDVAAQLDKVLTDLATGSGTAKLLTAAGPAWKDGTTNPAERLDQRLDSIVSDLAGNGGAAKLGVPVSPAWFDAATRAAEGLQARVDGIITDLASVNGANKVGLPAAPTWHPTLGSARSSEGVQARVDGIVSDLASEAVASGWGGAGLVGLGSAPAHFTNAQSVGSALDALASRVRGSKRYARVDLVAGFDSSSTPGGGGGVWALGNNGSRKRWQVTSGVTASHSLYFALNNVPDGATITDVWAIGETDDADGAFTFSLGLRSHRQDTLVVGAETIDFVNAELEEDVLFSGVGAKLTPVNVGTVDNLVYQYFVTCHVEDTDVQGTAGSLHSIYGIVVGYTLPTI